MADTDSALYHVECPEDPRERMRTCTYETDGVRFDVRGSPREGQLGAFGGELGEDVVLEGTFAGSKCYCLLTLSGKGKIRCKGVPLTALQRKAAAEGYSSVYELYRRGQASGERLAVPFGTLQPQSHVLQVRRTQRLVLGSLNDKVFQISPTESRPLGHWRSQFAALACASRGANTSMRKFLGLRLTAEIAEMAVGRSPPRKRQRAPRGGRSA